MAKCRRRNSYRGRKNIINSYSNNKTTEADKRFSYYGDEEQYILDIENTINRRDYFEKIIWW